MPGRIDARLRELGITLPAAAPPQANYVPFVVTGNLAFIAGQISRLGNETIAGKVGGSVNLATAQKGARWCALGILAHLKTACGGDLDRVKRFVKLGGFVNAVSDFPNSPLVINGASDLLVEIFGDAGRHARFAVAVASLPANAAVEIDAVAEIG
jgi:enamine deaminase RidA (YjgF/YER057c/UK114 family)